MPGWQEIKIEANFWEENFFILEKFPTYYHDNLAKLPKNMSY